MCEPTTIMLGISLVAGAVSAVGQRRSAKGQMAAAATQRQVQGEEISAKAGREAGERVKQGRAERARLRVAGGEAGISGNSFAASLMDVAFQQNEDVTAVLQDAGFAQRGSEARFKSGLAGVKNPGAIETTLNIAKAGAQGYATGLQIKTARAGGKS